MTIIDLTRRVALAALMLGVLAVGCGPAQRAAKDAAESTEAHASPGEHHDEHGEHAEGEPQAVTLSPEAIANAKLAFGLAAPRDIAVTADAPGEVHMDLERVFEVRPRYPGVVRELPRHLGQHVSRGDLLAVVQGNESLSDYEIRSPLSGTVVSRTAIAGQAVDHESVMLTVADLSHVWVDFAVYPQHVDRVRPGLPVRITATGREDLSANARVSYVGPMLEQDTRVSSARVVLPNAGGRWPPGLFVTVRLELERARVAVAVPEAAIVRTREGAAVFRVHGERFELTPVQTGRSDGRFTEIVSGLAAGDSVVTANAFVLKSELGKGEAGHEH